jgi:SET domain-containing protein
MVIEYIGELIRNEVANNREKLYEQQNRGIYMFRLDDDNVVDATVSGCLARYMNHSCEVDFHLIAKKKKSFLLNFLLAECDC